MIPDFGDNVLPDGVHLCTLEEVAARFGRFQRSDRRQTLLEKLRRYVDDVRRAGTASALIVDGSFITAKHEPSDIDLILVLVRELDPSTEVTPQEYNVQSKRMTRKLYGFDVRSAVDGSESYEELVAFFSQVKLGDPGLQTSRTTKGLLRLSL